MSWGGEGRRGRHAACRGAVVAAVALLVACGSPSSDGAAAPRRTTVPAPLAKVATSGDDEVEQRAVAPPSTTAVPTTARPTVTSASAVAPQADARSTEGDTTAPLDLDADDSLDGFTTVPRSGPAGTDGTALLRAVRVGHHEGFDRIVFEFTGGVRPGYRVSLADGPTYADGSGDVVTVAGEATLQVVLQPASGVDMETGKPVYTGPDRVPVPRTDGVLQELVRTGDFEGVLSWAIGIDRARSFRVSTLAGPSRVVVDVRAA